MLSNSFLAYYIGANACIYLLIHIPLDILTLKEKTENKQQEGKKYPPWEENKNASKIIAIFTSLLFWLFFLGWPIIHLFNIDNWFLKCSFNIPYLGFTFQIIGLILITAATIIACVGRISRGTKAISWGVPTSLVKSLGFRIVRHPLYASYCYYFLGIPLAMQNYILLVLILGIFGYYTTTKYEEKILVKEFGEEYKKYQAEVGMLIPFIGRKKSEEDQLNNE
jgi:protein-S-isoprenylcysteine O-methyltransferase Ste14